MDDDQLVKNIQDGFISKGLTLSLAESCTGGHLAARLTKIPGCSQYFIGSLVAYSNQLKMKILGVNHEMLLEHGAVSEPVALQMAQGMMEISGSDLCLVVTGIAGPEGGTALTPVGTIWGAIARRGDQPFAWKFHIEGKRIEIIEKTVIVLLHQLWLLIKT